MKKTYKVEVDCPTCASKLEKCVLKIDGVQDCKVNVMTQKLSIEADPDKQESIIRQVVKEMKDIDDDVVIYC